MLEHEQRVLSREKRDGKVSYRPLLCCALPLAPCDLLVTDGLASGPCLGDLPMELQGLAKLGILNLWRCHVGGKCSASPRDALSVNFIGVSNALPLQRRQCRYVQRTTVAFGGLFDRRKVMLRTILSAARVAVRGPEGVVQSNPGTCEG